MEKFRGTRENYGPVGSNTDSGSKRGVPCIDITTMYLAFIFRNYYFPLELFELLPESLSCVNLISACITSSVTNPILKLITA
jgi:hypothetical protein